MSGAGYDPRGFMPAASEGPKLVTNPDAEKGEVATWFHDDSVEAGKTYRYRMRVKLWNRYLGQMRAVRAPESAKEPILVGEWSLPSDPVTVTPSTYFFLKGGRENNLASVEVWKWRDGDWVRQTFEVAVGDVIGGVRKVRREELDDKTGREDVDFTTGAVVLDLRTDVIKKRYATDKKGGFSYRIGPSPVMVYLDPADGQVKERTQVFDRDDPILKKLKDEFE